MKTYIRVKGTKRWFRFKIWESDLDFVELNKIKTPHQEAVLSSSVESYHEENHLDSKQIYEITNDKEYTMTIEVKEYLKPCYSARIIR